MQMSKFSTKAILVVVMIVVLTLGAGIVGAQDDDNGPRRPGQGQGGRLGDLISLVAEQTGLTAQEIMTQVRDGATLADVISNNGGDVDAVVDAILADAEARLSEAVAEERITQEQMDTRLATLEETVFAVLNGEFEPRSGGNGNGQGPRDGVRNLLQFVVEATGLDVETLREQLQDGATLAEIIEANGGDVDAIINTIVSTVTERVNERVEAGEMDAERAEQILSNLEETVTNFLNGERPERPMPPQTDA